MKMHNALVMTMATGIAVLLLSACAGTKTLHRDRLQEKTEPYDLFAFQRSFPDSVFDLKAWRKALQTARIDAAAAIFDRNAGCQAMPGNWQLRGPGNVGGRVNAMALQPGKDSVLLAGFSAGGIFKTVDGGHNWKAVFDDHLELSIGDINFDPNNPNIVYAGTGDPNVPSNVFNGAGLFKSTDAGESWQYLALEDVGIISKVIVSPANPQRLYVASMGNPYIRDERRGVYKSEDGGQSWSRVLFVDDQAGASDLVMHPDNDQILYASFWDRVRNNQESVIYGPHAQVYKTTDGGQHWTLLGNGLPTGPMGRTGLVISGQNPDKLYAVYVDTTSNIGGLYLTLNGGESWSAVNISGLPGNVYNNFGWYFAKIRLNPDNDDELYFLGVTLWRRLSNGNWQPIGGGHADSHDFIISPSGRRYWANDGGVYRSAAGQSGFSRCFNLPTTQLYHTDFNPLRPNRYYFGAQDNGIQSGQEGGFNQFTQVFGADGFNCVFNPVDSNIFWVQTQNGAIHKTLDDGDSWTLGDIALGTVVERVNWDMPFFSSPHNPLRRYAATYRAYSTITEFWSPISPDLTDGNIYGDRFHNVSALDESPILEGKLIAGTSDGNVWRREPTGDWVNITANLPNRYLTSVHGSSVSPERIFVTQSGFRDNDETPHIHRSDDNGLSWQGIAGNLPPVPVNDLWIMPGQNDLALFVATDAGVYFSLDGGLKWSRLGGNMPVIPVFDLEENPVRRELMAATFARGLWTFSLDSVLNQPQGVFADLPGVVLDENGEGVINVTFPGYNGDPSDAAGAFELVQTPACTPQIFRPYRNDGPLNGVSTFDLALINKHIQAVDLLDSPYKLIAADANRNGVVTATDIVVLRRLVLGLDSIFKQNTSWRFVPGDFVFVDPGNPFAPGFPDSMVLTPDTYTGNMVFTGIKTGDVSGDAEPNALTASDDRNTGVWPLFVRYRQAPDGAWSAELSADWSDVAALQFSLAHSAKQVCVAPLAEGLSAQNVAGDNCPETGQAGKPPEVLRFSFEPPAGIGRAAVWQLHFHTASGEKPLLRLLDNPTRAAVYGEDGQYRKPVLLELPEPGNWALWPNPADATGVWLYGPAGAGIIRVFDVSGRLLGEGIRAEAAETSLLPAGWFRSGIHRVLVQDAAGRLVFSQTLVIAP